MNREVFYQSRSTRINLDLYKPRYKRHEYGGEEIGVKIIDASEMVKLLGLPHIYSQYMKRKKFTQDYDPFAHYHPRDQFMIFYTGSADNIIGFTKQKRYRWEDDHYKKQYRRLCKRDSRIESLRDVGNLSLIPDNS
jgi:hypothetical protein